MFVTVVSTDALPETGEDTVVKGLGEILEGMHGSEVPGFKQAFLLRGEKGRAMIVALWETERDAQAFLSSETGKNAAEKQDRLFGRSGRKERFNLTWQARPGVGIE